MLKFIDTNWYTVIGQNLYVHTRNSDSLDVFEDVLEYTYRVLIVIQNIKVDLD